MATQPSAFTFESGHSDLIHDVQLDYYGKTLATASSDHTIKIFEVIRDQHKYLADLQGHTGPVWRVSWSHPKYNSLLASCGYDKRVIIWSKSPQSQSQSQQLWNPIYNDVGHSASVNCIQWAPVDCGLILAAGCADGNITIYEHKNNTWEKTTFSGHLGGVNGISWSNQTNIISIKQPLKSSSQQIGLNNNNNNQLVQDNVIIRRFCSGGCDNLLKLWHYSYNDNKWICESSLNHGHSDWIRDVSWAPLPGITSHSIIATCSEDKSVIIWKERNKQWKQIEKLLLPYKVWSVSWSEMGNILAVACGDNHIQLYKEGLDSKWHEISKLNPST